MASLERFFLLLSTCVAAYSYETYVVERSCSSGNMNLPLLGEGPGSAFLLHATDRPFYILSLDCWITLSAPAGCRIMVAIQEIGFRTNLDGSCKDYLEIFRRPMCQVSLQLDEERHYASEGNTLMLRYHVSKEGTDNATSIFAPGFRLTVTAFTDKSDCPAVQDGSWFRCDNGFCIWSKLICDTHNNCGDLSDEQDCGSGGGGGAGSTVLIILGSLIVILLIIMCTATLCSKNETVRRFSNRLRSRTLSFVPRLTR